MSEEIIYYDSCPKSSLNVFSNTPVKKNALPKLIQCDCKSKKETQKTITYVYTRSLKTAPSRHAISHRRPRMTSVTAQNLSKLGNLFVNNTGVSSEPNLFKMVSVDEFILIFFKNPVKSVEEVPTVKYVTSFQLRNDFIRLPQFARNSILSTIE